MIGVAKRSDPIHVEDKVRCGLIMSEFYDNVVHRHGYRLFRPYTKSILADVYIESSSKQRLLKMDCPDYIEPFWWPKPVILKNPESPCGNPEKLLGSLKEKYDVLEVDALMRGIVKSIAGRFASKYGVSLDEIFN